MQPLQKSLNNKFFDLIAIVSLVIGIANYRMNVFQSNDIMQEMKEHQNGKLDEILTTVKQKKED